jgi:peptidoglycan L-alanyl-D-glutamate endopeptidase CwlK
MDANSEARLNMVHPALAAKVRQMADILDEQFITIRVTQGLRSMDEQAALYAQGRTTPGKIVTNALPGTSWHNFGLAVDVAPFDAEGQPDWNVNHPSWKNIVATGEGLGLFSGSKFRTFPDWPHFQLTGDLPVSPDDATRQAFKVGGLLAVWSNTGLGQGEVNA